MFYIASSEELSEDRSHQISMNHGNRSCFLETSVELFNFDDIEMSPFL